MTAGNGVSDAGAEDILAKAWAGASGAKNGLDQSAGDQSLDLSLVDFATHEAELSDGIWAELLFAQERFLRFKLMAP